LHKIQELHKETGELKNMKLFKASKAEELSGFTSSDQKCFYTLKPDNLYSKYINNLKSQNKYDPETHSNILSIHIDIPIADKSQYVKFFFFKEVLFTTVESNPDILETRLGHWILNTKDELAECPDLNTTGQKYIHLHPIFRL
jgi:hypothetical protein